MARVSRPSLNIARKGDEPWQSPRKKAPTTKAKEGLPPAKAKPRGKIESQNIQGKTELENALMGPPAEPLPDEHLPLHYDEQHVPNIYRLIANV
jgi:hypothetical protein